MDVTHWNRGINLMLLGCLALGLTGCGSTQTPTASNSAVPDTVAVSGTATAPVTAPAAASDAESGSASETAAATVDEAALGTSSMTNPAGAAAVSAATSGPATTGTEPAAITATVPVTATVPAMPTDRSPATVPVSPTTPTAPTAPAVVDTTPVQVAQAGEPKAPGAGAPSDSAPTAATPSRRAWLQKIFESQQVDYPHKNQLKQIGLALHNFHDTFNHFPAIDSLGNDDSPQGLSWRVHLLPYLDEAELYNQFHVDEPWDSDHNKTLIAKMPKIFGNLPDGKTRFQMFLGNDAPFERGAGLAIEDVGDGLSNTLGVVMAGEDRADIWTKPGGLAWDPKDPAAAFGKAGAEPLALWLDGRVTRINLKSPALTHMILANDGMEIPEADLGYQIQQPVAPFEVVPPGPMAPVAKTLDLKYIPESALVAVVAHPRRFFEQPVMQELVKKANWKNDPQFQAFDLFLPTYDMDKVREFGVRAEWIDEVRFIIGPDILQFDPSEFDAPPAMLFYVHASTPFGDEAMVRNFLRASYGGNFELRQAHGVDYLCDVDRSVCLAPLTNREFLLGQEALLKTALDPQARALPDSPLGQKLLAPGNRMGVAVGVMTPEIRQQVQLIAQQLPREATLFLPYVTQLTNITAAVDLAAPELLKLDAALAKPELAEGLNGMLAAPLAAGKQQFEAMKPQMEQAAIATALPLLTELVDGVTLTQVDSRVTLTVPRPEKLKDLPAILDPFLAQAREAARRTEQRNQLKQIGLSMHIFHDAHDQFPAIDGTGDDEAGRDGLSWRVHLLPHMGEQKLYDQFKLDEAWDSPHNKALIAKMPKFFGNNAEGKTRIHLLTGGGAPWKFGKALRIRDIIDGTSNTIMAVEAAEDTAEFWTKPTALKFDPKSPLQCLGKLDEKDSGLHALFMDGSVRFISQNIDEEVFRRLVQHQDGEPVGEF